MDCAQRLDAGGLNGLVGSGLFLSCLSVYVPTEVAARARCSRSLIKSHSRPQRRYVSLLRNERESPHDQEWSSTGPHGLAVAIKLVTPVAAERTTGECGARKGVMVA